MFKLIKKVPYLYLIAVPMLLMFMGTASNQAVLIANGDRFPVMANEVRLAEFCNPSPIDALLAQKFFPEVSNACTATGMLDSTHEIMTPKTHLNFLADIFDMHTAIFSIGDFLLMLGEWAWDISVIAWLALVLRKFIEV
jgi:hypothetical protein